MFKHHQNSCSFKSYHSYSAYLSSQITILDRAFWSEQCTQHFNKSMCMTSHHGEYLNLISNTIRAIHNTNTEMPIFWFSEAVSVILGWAANRTSDGCQLIMVSIQFMEVCAIQELLATQLSWRNHGQTDEGKS